MANGLDFADLRETIDFRAHVALAQNGCGVDRRYVERWQLVALLAGRTLFKQQELVLCDVRTNFSDHAAWGTGSKARPTSSICSRLVISVAHRRIQCSNSG